VHNRLSISYFVLNIFQAEIISSKKYECSSLFLVHCRIEKCTIKYVIVFLCEIWCSHGGENVDVKGVRLCRVGGKYQCFVGSYCSKFKIVGQILKLAWTHFEICIAHFQNNSIKKIFGYIFKIVWANFQNLFGTLPKFQNVSTFFKI
jgi:hypothetical protein